MAPAAGGETPTDAELFDTWEQLLAAQKECHAAFASGDKGAFEAACAEAEIAKALLIAAPASTVRGLALKTSAFLHFDLNASEAWAGLSYAKPTKAQRILLSLRDDLMRLANLPRDLAIEHMNAVEV